MFRAFCRGDISYQSGDDYFGGKNRYEGFGNTPIRQDSKSAGHNELLEGTMQSLSLGWSAITKGATQAASIAKDIGSQAASKAVQLGGTVNEKVRLTVLDSSLLQWRIYNLA